MTARTEAANLINEVLGKMGALSAVVPRGELRILVDDEIDRLADLAKALGQHMPLDGSEAPGVQRITWTEVSKWAWTGSLKGIVIATAHYTRPGQAAGKPWMVGFDALGEQHVTHVKDMNDVRRLCEEWLGQAVASIGAAFTEAS